MNTPGGAPILKGQVWQDNDPRMALGVEIRTIEVVGFDRKAKKVKIRTIGSTRTSTAAPARFDGTNRGYTQIGKLIAGDFFPVSAR